MCASIAKSTNAEGVEQWCVFYKGHNEGCFLSYSEAQGMANLLKSSDKENIEVADYEEDDYEEDYQPSRSRLRF